MNIIICIGAFVLICLILYVVSEVIKAHPQEKCKCKEPMKDKNDCLICGGYIE